MQPAYCQKRKLQEAADFYRCQLTGASSSTRRKFSRALCIQSTQSTTCSTHWVWEKKKNFPNHCFRSFSDVVTKPEQKSPREFQLGKIKDPEIGKYHQHKHRQIIEGKAKRGVH